MPFLTQGKTNWKFLMILVVLAAIVGGGILWWAATQETPQPLEIKIPPKVQEETTSKAPELKEEINIPQGLETILISDLKKNYELDKSYLLDSDFDKYSVDLNDDGEQEFVFFMNYGGGPSNRPIHIYQQIDGNWTEIFYF